MSLFNVDLTDITTQFSPDRVASRIVQRDVSQFRALNRWWPNRETWDMPTVPVEDISAITRSVPMVLRGTPGTRIQPESLTRSWFEPHPVKPVDQLEAVEYNNLQLFRPTNLETYSNRIIDRMIDHVFKTADGIAAQAKDGIIQWPLWDNQGGFIGTANYDFGSANKQSYTVTEDWTLDATKLSTVLLDLIAMEQVMMEAGYAGQLRIAVGAVVFSKLAAKVNALPNDARIEARIEERDSRRVIVLSGYVIELENGTYWNPETEASVKIVQDNDLYMYDASAPWTFLWVMPDNFKLQGTPIPLGIVPTISDDGAQANIYGEAKPFPIPPVRAILKTDVTVT